MRSRTSASVSADVVVICAGILSFTLLSLLGALIVTVCSYGVIASAWRDVLLSAMRCSSTSDFGRLAYASNVQADSAVFTSIGTDAIKNHSNDYGGEADAEDVDAHCGSSLRVDWSRESIFMACEWE